MPRKVDVPRGSAMIERVIIEGFAALEARALAKPATLRVWRQLVDEACLRQAAPPSEIRDALREAVSLWETWLDALPVDQRLTAHGRVSALVMLCRQRLQQRPGEAGRARS